jgi:hypothetical protein
VGKVREGKGKRREGKGKRREGKGREGKGREGKGREGKEREGKKGREGSGRGVPVGVRSKSIVYSGLHEAFRYLAYVVQTEFQRPVF